MALNPIWHPVSLIHIKLCSVRLTKNLSVSEIQVAAAGQLVFRVEATRAIQGVRDESLFDRLQFLNAKGKPSPTAMARR